MTRPAPQTALLLVFATVCVDLLGFGLVLPLLPIYGRELTESMPPHEAGLTLGILMSCFTMMQFVFAPVWGRLSDRLGRRPILLLSLAGSTAFYFLFGLASAWRSLPWLFAARIGAGIAGATIPTAQAYIGTIQCLVQGIFVRRMARSVSEPKLAAIGSFLSITGFLLMAAMAETSLGGIPLLMLATAIEVSGIAFIFPAVQALISRRTDPSEQGGILGAGESVSAMGRTAGIMSGVWLYNLWPGVPYWSAAAMMAAVMGLVFLAAQRGTDYAEALP